MVVCLEYDSQCAQPRRPRGLVSPQVRRRSVGALNYEQSLIFLRSSGCARAVRGNILAREDATRRGASSRVFSLDLRKIRDYSQSIGAQATNNLREDPKTYTISFRKFATLACVNSCSSSGLRSRNIIACEQAHVWAARITREPAGEASLRESEPALITVNV